MNDFEECYKNLIHDLNRAKLIMVHVGDARFFVTKEAVLKQLKEWPYKVDYTFQITNTTSYVSISSMKI